MKKNLFLVVFIFLCVLQNLNAQMITEETDLFPVSVSIEQDKDKDGNTTGYTSSAYSLGRKKEYG